MKAEFVARIREEGRITVPKEVRDVLDLRKNDLVKCGIEKLATK